jgi:uncharacterized protein (UPF0332 family)
MDYKELQDMGMLEERVTETVEVIGLITRAERDLATSRLLQEKDEEWAFAAAYLAMARSARALILSEGYRPKGVRGRDIQKTIVTAVGVILGRVYKSLINKLTACVANIRTLWKSQEGDPKYEASQAIKDAEFFGS